MIDTITKTTTMSEAKEILHDNCISTPYGWEIVLGMLLEQCDYIKITGLGASAKFELITE